MSIEKDWEGRTRLYIPTCDGCGAELEPEYDFDDAVEAKRRAGWRSKNIQGEWVDICPDCEMKEDWSILRGLENANRRRGWTLRSCITTRTVHLS